MRALPTLGLALALALVGVGAAASEIRATIRGVASSSGTLMIALYDSEAHFRTAIANAGKQGLLVDRARLVGVAMRAAAGSQTAVFTNLTPGAYAIITYHDANDNGRLDETVLGIPTEGYGFSNDAEGFLGAPSFKQAAIILGNHDKAIGITLRYPTGGSQKQ
jgi:uncharacterized protein (DUF2141 family)